jgi:hypothetical protein
MTDVEVREAVCGEFRKLEAAMDELTRLAGLFSPARREEALGVEVIVHKLRWYHRYFCSEKTMNKRHD